jgi:carbamoyl-phosphate synthase large subunit
MVGFNEPDLLIRKHLFNEEIEPSFRFDSGLIIRSLQENRVNN